MKKLEISVEEEYYQNIEDVLNSLKLSYSKFSSRSDLGKTFFYQTTVVDEALDSTLEKLSGAMDLRKSDNQIFVLDVLAYVSTRLSNLQKKAAVVPTKNPVELIVQPLDQHLKFSKQGTIMIVLATIVVLAGLLLNNIPIIIGSMLLSPLLGPVSAAIVNGSLGRTKQLLRSEGIIFSLVLVSIVISSAVSFILSHMTTITLSEQIVSRTNPPVFEVIVAIALGMAAGLALTTKLPETLVGVAIAAALLPPLGVAGIYLGIGDLHDFFNAFLLTMIYLFGLKVGGITFLRFSGISPRKFYEVQRARRYGVISLSIYSIILLILIVILVFRI